MIVSLLLGFVAGMFFVAAGLRAAVSLPDGRESASALCAMLLAGTIVVPLVLVATLSWVALIGYFIPAGFLLYVIAGTLVSFIRTPKR